MTESSKKGQGKIKKTGVSTFPVPLALEEIQEDISILTNTATQPPKEQLINEAFQLHSAGIFKKQKSIINFSSIKVLLITEFFLIMDHF